AEQVGPHVPRPAQVALERRPRGPNLRRADEQPDVAGVGFPQKRTHPVGALVRLAGPEEAAELPDADVAPPKEVRAGVCALEVARGGGQRTGRGHRDDHSIRAWLDRAARARPRPRPQSTTISSQACWKTAMAWASGVARSPSQMEAVTALSPVWAAKLRRRLASWASPSSEEQAPGPTPAMMAAAQRLRSPLIASSAAT